jgi:hypothetical protein
MELNTIYLVCAAAGGTILVIRVVLMLIGMDGGEGSGPDVSVDVNHDGVVDASDSGGFNLFSLQSVAGFFTMFGLVGMGMLQINSSEVISLAAALAAGLLTAWATANVW